MNECMNERNVSICNCVSVCVCMPFAITSLYCAFFSTFASLNELNIYSYEIETNWK